VPTIISSECPDTEAARELIAELDAHLIPLYPAESRHGFSIQKLLQENVAFFVLRHEGLAAGCGGIKLFAPDYGEIKRMYVRPQFRRLGLAKRMLGHLSEYALAKGIRVLRLETGIFQPEAIALYESEGFRQIPPFSPYREDPLSRFYERRLD